MPKGPTHLQEARDHRSLRVPSRAPAGALGATDTNPAVPLRCTAGLILPSLRLEEHFIFEPLAPLCGHPPAYSYVDPDPDPDFDFDLPFAIKRRSRFLTCNSNSSLELTQPISLCLQCYWKADVNAFVFRFFFVDSTHIRLPWIKPAHAAASEWRCGYWESLSIDSMN